MTRESRVESDLRDFYAAIPKRLPEEVAEATSVSIRAESQRGRPRWASAITAATVVAVVAATLAVVGSRPDQGLPSPTIPQESSAASSPPAEGVGLVAGGLATATRDFSIGRDQVVVAGQSVLIVAGPLDHDGIPSYRIQHYGDLEAGYRPDGNLGWLAVSAAMTALEPRNPNCPDEPPDLARIAALQPFERLLCFGRRDLSFGPVTASTYEVGVRLSRRWLSSDGRPDFFTGLPYVRADSVQEIGDSDWVNVVGHFDDPSAATCGDEGLVAFCRAQFHITAVEPATPPDFVLTGSWRPTILPSIDGRSQHAMVWTGSEAVIWGGFASSPDHSTFDATVPRGGAAYDPVTDSWRIIPDAPIPGRGSPVIAWTGREVIAFGGWVGELSHLDGAAWNPATSTWRKIAASPLSGSEAIGSWLADRLIVITSTSAAAYDPEADRWTELPAAPIRAGWRTAAVAAGRLFVVAFGDGATPPVDWAVLDPATSTWTSGKAPIDPLEAGVVFIGAGDQIVVTDTGDTFDPLTTTWGTGRRCEGASAGTVWTGRYLLGVTAAWDSLTGACLQLPPAPPREPPFDDSNGREFPVAVWTGREYITWSGGNGGDIVGVPKDGAVFRPDNDIGP